jgi:HlyD family secretion protein
MKRIALAAVIIILVSSCGAKKEKEATTAPVNTTLDAEKVIALGRVEPAVKITGVGAEVAGVIKRIYVNEGDSVKAGDLLIELSHDYEDAKVAQVQAKFKGQEADIKTATAQLQSAEFKLTNSLDKFERLKKVFAQGAETKQNLDNAELEYQQAQSDITRLKANIESAKSKLTETSADLRVAQADVSRRMIKAPADGVVLTMDLTEGSTVSTNSSLFEFAPNSDITVLSEVDELFANKIKLGQQVIIRTQGMDDTLAVGEVMQMAPYLKKKSLFSEESGNMEDRRVREVRVKLNGNPALLINSRVEAVIALK